MKLSEKTTDEVREILCQIAPMAANIFGDKKLMDSLSEKMPEGKHSIVELYRFAANKYAVIVPVVLKDHCADVYGILAVLENKTPQEIGKQRFMTTMEQVREAVQDKELMDFLSLCRHGGTTE